MNNLINLMPLIGREKTVLVTGMDFDIADALDFNENVFVHFAKESRLYRYDTQQQEMLRYYIEDKNCSQIIFLGSLDHTLIERIKSDYSIHSPLQALRFNLQVLLRNHDESIVTPAVKAQILIEMNVVNQCKLLMDYYFISSRVEKKLLDIKGVVVDLLGDKLKPIFHNSILYNDILSSN
jgi:hypothetical protein